MKGDLKWFAEKLCWLERTFKQVTSKGPSACCHECLAGTLDRPFEDICLSPSWADSHFTVRPWNPENLPSFLTIPFGRGGARPEKSIRRDLFHNGKMGLIRDFAGSTIRMLAYMKYWHSNTESNRIDLLLERAHAHFALFCATSVPKRSPKLRSFTATFLNCGTRRKYPWANCHGSDGIHLLEWLVVFTRGALQSPLDPSPSHVKILQLMNMTGRAALDWNNHVYHHGIFWNRHCGATFFQFMWGFLKGYVELARLSLQMGWAAYGLKPKLHMLDHTKAEIYTWLRAGNHSHFPSPIMWMCDMNEDMIGKLSRMARRVSPVLMSERCFTLYCIKGRALYRRWSAKPDLKRPKKRSARQALSA